MRLFQTTLAGSLPKPAWLAEPETLWAPWVPSSPERLQEAKRDAVRLAILDQERCGLDIVSDGEQSRQHFVHGFLEGLDGIDAGRKRRIAIRNDRYQADCPTVTAELARPRPVHRDEVAFARAQSERKLKFTLPGPMTAVDTLADDHYGGDREAMALAMAEILNAEARDLAAAGADVVQFDEPAFNAYTELVPGWGVRALNRAVAGLDCTTAVHICYGYGIQANIDWKARLGQVWAEYDAILPPLADSDIDQISLEFAGSRVPLEVLKHVGGRKDILVGAIDVASDAVETPGQVAQVIEGALAYLPAERVFPCTNCGMAPMRRDIAYGKLARLAEGAELARARQRGRGGTAA